MISGTFWWGSCPLSAPPTSLAPLAPDELAGRGCCFAFLRPLGEQFHRMSCSSEHAETQLWRQACSYTHTHTLSSTFFPPLHGLSLASFPRCFSRLVCCTLEFLRDETTAWEEFDRTYFNKNLIDILEIVNGHQETQTECVYLIASLYHL